jgi:CheY-like chemotaxis protein/phosphoribosyl 1,2-cyclic phosphodiesterase
MIAEVNEALRNKDTQKVQFVAHKLKGSGTIFGLDVMTSYASEIEGAVASDDLARAAKFGASLTSYLENVEIVSEAQKTQRRVLIADDTEDIREYIIHLLNTHGYEVASASDGTECLKKIDDFKPELIVLDIMMPGMHGFDVLKSLKGNPATQNIGVIICSAKSYKPDQDLAMSLGAYGYIDKPFRKDLFLQTVEKYFQRETRQEKIPPSAPTGVVTQELYVPTLDRTKPFIKLWGTRGSIPVSGVKFQRHGGNTPCVEITSGDETVIIDAGTGIRELGVQLASCAHQRLHLFIGHTHWDHIQGFPFFPPAYNPRVHLTVYGASGFGKNLKAVFGGQLDADYFPVQLEDLRSKIEFVELKVNPVQIGDIKIYWEYVHHPGAAIGFVIELGGKRYAYITDNEFLKGYLGSPLDIKADSEILQSYKSFIEFIRNVDVLIGEAQYPNDEYAKKIGWGHTGLANGCLLCKLAGVKRWVVVHHDPMHDDDFLLEKLSLTEQILKQIDYPIPVSNAYDGWVEYVG